MAVRFFVICYGEKHVDLYERVAVRSLMQDRNRAAIPPDAIVSLYSDEATMPRAVSISERLGRVESHVLAMKENHYDTQNQAFIEEIGFCVRQEASLVIVNPDNYWGNGSLANMLTIAGQRSICLASPHIRVDREKFLEALPEGSIDNPSLVSLAMRTLHKSWIDADLGKKQANSFFTGIGIQKIGDGLHMVSHLQPTVFYAHLSARDYGFFAERPQARGLWDHAWPAILAQEGRQRTVACSDAVFIVELTDGDTHSTDLREIDPKKPDEFCRDGPHIGQNRNVIGVWREA